MLGIIIPVHNRAELLREALQSLTVQTKKRFITIVVDDCSTESIKKVTDEFQNKLNLVNLRRNCREGVAAARQAGIDWAVSNNLELVMFLDGDDMLMPNAVDRLTYEINHCRCDVVMSDIVIEKENGLGGKIDADESLTWTHGKIYRLKFLTDNSIKFLKELTTNEDLCFNLCCNLIAQNRKSIKQINESLYLWRQREDSITHTQKTRNKCNGEDYINAVYNYTIYALAHTQKFLPHLIVPNIIAIYNYYQYSKLVNGEISDELENRVKMLLNLPIIQQEVSKNFHKYEQNLRVCRIENGEIFWFTETFGNWFNRLKEKSNETNNC